MKPTVFIFLLLMNVDTIKAQEIAGEYYLNGVMETASGLKINTDSSFEFFFSYGALDRFGKGNGVYNRIL